MQVGAKDKRIKALNAGQRGVKGWPKNIETLVVEILAVLIAAPNLATVSMAHPSWRVHHHKPRNLKSPWSIDVTGNTRLLFFYDIKTHFISGLVFDDPHA